jgi:ribosomal protein S1
MTKSLPSAPSSMSGFTGLLGAFSAMANTYVKDPRKIAKSGDVVRVKVLEVDTKRRRDGVDDAAR